jgi:O-antigen ligase
MLIASSWSATFAVPEFLATLRLALYILAFILLSAYALRKKPAVCAHVIELMCVAAALAAAISIPLWYAEHPFPASRIIGIGTLENSNPSAFVYGFFALLSCHLALRRGRLALRLLFLLCTLVLGGYVALTQSNTGILATVTAIALLLLLRGTGTHRYRIGGILITGGSLAFLAWSVGILDRPMDSGLSQRIPIWQAVIAQIEQAPLVGNGYQKQLFPDAQGAPGAASYAHSALLASARDGGLVALALHLLILGTALVTAVRYFRQHNDPVYLAYLLFGFLCMLVDTDQLITRPRELWVIFWWPLAALVAVRLRTPSTCWPQETGREQRAS